MVVVPSPHEEVLWVPAVCPQPQFNTRIKRANAPIKGVHVPSAYADVASSAEWCACPATFTCARRRCVCVCVCAESDGQVEAWMARALVLGVPLLGRVNPWMTRFREFELMELHSRPVPCVTSYLVRASTEQNEISSRGVATEGSSSRTVRS